MIRKEVKIIIIFLYKIISAILLYFVIRYGIRDGMVETEANKDKLIHVQKSNVLFGDISRIYLNLSRSKNEKNLRSEEHTSELQSRGHLVCRLLLEKKKEKDASKEKRRSYS